MKISGIKPTTGFIVGSLQKLNGGVVGTERDLIKPQKTSAGSDFCENIFTEKVLSLTEELSSLRVGRAILRIDLIVMTALM